MPSPAPRPPLLQDDEGVKTSPAALSALAASSTQTSGNVQAVASGAEEGIRFEKYSILVRAARG
jgi:hypothetical protein